MPPALRISGACAPFHDDPQFYARVPNGVTSRKDLSDRAHRVLTGLLGIAGERGKRAWVTATLCEIAEACGRCISTVRRGIAELVAKSIIEWQSIGHKFTMRFKLRGDAYTSEPEPSPPPVSGVARQRVAQERATVWRAAVPPLEPPYKEERKKETTQTVLSFFAPPEEPETRKDTVVAQEPVTQKDECDSLILRAQSLVPVSAAQVRRWVDIYGPVATDLALVTAENFRKPIYAPGWIEGVLRNQRAAAERADAAPAPPQQNHNSAPRESKPAIPAATPEEIAGLVAAGQEDWPVGPMARSRLRHYVNTGQVSRDAIPADLLAPEPAQKKATVRSLVPASSPPRNSGTERCDSIVRENSVTDKLHRENGIDEQRKE